MTIRRMPFSLIALTTALLACADVCAAENLPPIGRLGTETLASLASGERATALGGVQFGSSPDAVAKVMADLGLRPKRDQDADERFAHDQYFDGRLKDHPVFVIALYDGAGSVQKMVVSFLTPDKECLTFYRRFKEELKEKYVLSVEDRLTVWLVYESSEWSQESDRRKRIQNVVF